jgi:hypothetical protein
LPALEEYGAVCHQLLSCRPSPCTKRRPSSKGSRRRSVQGSWSPSCLRWRSTISRGASHSATSRCSTSPSAPCSWHTEPIGSWARLLLLYRQLRAPLPWLNSSRLSRSVDSTSSSAYDWLQRVRQPRRQFSELSYPWLAACQAGLFGCSR